MSLGRHDGGGRGVWTLLLLLTIAQASHPEEGCVLQPSELGPDWYKVPKPIPAEFQMLPNHPESFYHMPCAASTVFDQTICGCTNVMSLLFSRKAYAHGSLDLTKVGPKDIIKVLDPVVSTTTPKPGSILFNTRTGEVKSCPFRPSPKGPRWYMVREPNANWKQMQCARGTVFHERTCGCIHEKLTHRDPSKPEDEDIVVLTPEEDFRRQNGDGKISKSLNIKVSDVFFDHFNKESADTNQRHYVTESPIQKTKDQSQKHDVVVFSPALKTGKQDSIRRKDRRTNSRSRLFTDGRLFPEPNPLSIDSHDGNILALDNGVPIMFEPVLRKWENGKKGKKTEYVPFKIPEDKPKNELKPNTDMFKDLWAVDEVYFPLEECSKQPAVELGPQYFSMYLWGVGWIPYACHGNRIYSHKLCACVSVPRTR